MKTHQDKFSYKDKWLKLGAEFWKQYNTHCIFAYMLVGVTFKPLFNTS